MVHMMAPNFQCQLFVTPYNVMFDVFIMSKTIGFINDTNILH